MPTVVDRLIQQALHQVLQPLFEPTFSAGSFGFRPGRGAHQAVRKAQEYIRAGKRWWWTSIGNTSATPEFKLNRRMRNRMSGGVGGR